MVVFLVFLSLFLGARGAFIWPLVFLSAYSCFMKKGKVSFLRYGAVIVSILWLALYANKIRQQQYNPLAILGSFLLDLFYGNHLSDTRDFAWVLAYWDGEFLFGKTFLSGLISFIPRFLSEFRDQWAIGVYTASVAGYDPSTHYGLRPGLFGESYFNFGYVGVSTMGFFLGYTLRYADVKIKEAIETSRDIIAGYSHAIFFTFVATMAVSAGVWAFYLFVIINVLLLFVPFTSYRRISSLRYKNENSACS